MSRLFGDCCTPLLSTVWEAALEGHPDRNFVSFIVVDLKCGFRIGFDGTIALTSAAKNMPSASDQGDVISEYIASECK